MLSVLSLLRAISLRYLAKRWDRAGLIVVSISLGVAMLVSTQLLNECLDAAVRESTAPGIDDADLVVTSNRKVKLDLLPRLRAIPGVASAKPLVFDRVVLPDFDNRTAVLLGMEVKPDAKNAERSPFEAKITVTNPLAMATGRAAVLGSDLANALSPDGRPTKSFRVRAGGQYVDVTPFGTVELSGKGAKLGGFLIVMEASQAAKVLNQEGLVERIDLYLQPNASKGAVKAAVAEVVGGQSQVLSPEQVGQGSREIAGGVQIGFTLCGVGAMVVGLFLVYNALAVSVNERRHDIGVLRSMGATRPQIAGLFTGEALVLGVIGAFLGLPIGWFIAQATYNVVKLEMQQLFLATNQSMVITPQIFLLAILGGSATAVLAALVPSMQAASDEPADAVRRAPSGAGKLYRYVQGVASGLLVLGGFSVVLIRDLLPPRVGGLAGLVFLLVGLLMAVPLLVGWMATLIQPVFRRVFGIEARLAADNLLRAPGRTGVVVGALAAGVALMLQTAGIGKSNERPILEWLDRAVSADMFVVCGDPTQASSAALPMQPEIAQQIRDLDGVQNVMTVRYSQFEHRTKLTLMTAIDALVYHDCNRNAANLPQLPLFRQLAEPGTCLVSENFAALHHLKAGDSIDIAGPNGPVVLRVLGAVPEYSWSRGTVLIDRTNYAKEFDDSLIDSVHVFLNRSDDQAARFRVKELCDKNALVILTKTELNEYIANFLSRLYKLSYMQQIAVAIVAALGVVTALLISVMQRKRELGLLRAVGATQGQILWTVLAEAALMGVFGTILGLIAGVPLEWYLLRVVITEESGFVFPVLVPWRETLILSALAVLMATLAGLLPAIHAMRLRIADAIAYE